jgi:hypothetical protein
LCSFRSGNAQRKVGHGYGCSPPAREVSSDSTASTAIQKIKQIVTSFSPASPATSPHSGNGQLQGVEGNLLSWVARCSSLCPATTARSNGTIELIKTDPTFTGYVRA